MSFNKHFNSVFVKENSDKLPLFPSRLQGNISLNDIKISEELVYTRLEKLDLNKTGGVDGINPFILKTCASTLATPLAIIFRKSPDSDKIPSIWKKANISPIFKKGSRLVPANYRPVSLTSVCCKVLESMIRDSVMSFLSENMLISKNQHGFVKHKSCVTNLLESLDIATKALQLKQPLDVVYLDFAKAFDKVPHNRLMLKLEAYGIRGNLSCWIHDFLSERLQRVVLGTSQSCWSSVLSGVPQGSVLGPTLFIIYINDIMENLDNICKIYADDSKIFGKPGESMQSDLEKIGIWSKKWLMQLNVDKCKVMHIGKNNPYFDYFLHDQVSLQSHKLTTTNLERDLGIYISSDLKNKSQVDHAVAKASSVYAMLRNTFISRDPLLWKKLFTTYVRPHLEFAIQA